MLGPDLRERSSYSANKARGVPKLGSPLDRGRSLELERVPVDSATSIGLVEERSRNPWVGDRRRRRREGNEESPKRGQGWDRCLGWGTKTSLNRPHVLAEDGDLRRRHSGEL